MRELAAFYCPQCGHYAYYQTCRHPYCPKCCHSEPLHMIRMHYSEFMNMSCDERDAFLSKEILKTNPSLLERLTISQRQCSSREVIAEMNLVIMNLDTENKILSDTVKWMHDTVWELMREKRSSDREKTETQKEIELLRTIASLADEEERSEQMEEALKQWKSLQAMAEEHAAFVRALMGETDPT